MSTLMFLKDQINEFLTNNKKLIDDGDWGTVYEHTLGEGYEFRVNLIQLLYDDDPYFLEGYYKIPAFMFANTNIEKYKVPSSVIVIENFAFSDCKKLEEILIPPGVERISQAAFLNCFSLKEVKIPNTVTLIEDGAFEQCNGLERVEIPERFKSDLDIIFKKVRLDKIQFTFI